MIGDKTGVYGFFNNISSFCFFLNKFLDENQSKRKPHGLYDFIYLGSTIDMTIMEKRIFNNDCY